LDALRGNVGDCLSERVPVQRADYLTAVVEPLRHFEAPAPAYQWSGALLIHVVKAHQPEPAYFEQVAKALGCNQPGARAASLDDRVCRDGRAMDQFFDAVAGYAGLCKHVANSAENRLGVIPAGREDLAAGDAPVLGGEDEVGKGAADIDAQAASMISGHFIFNLLSPWPYYRTFVQLSHAVTALYPKRQLPTTLCGLSDLQAAWLLLIDGEQSGARR
jgi:hypothetical protein